MSTEGQMIYKIGIVGPTRVGKTSLITSILTGTQKLLEGLPFAMRPRGMPTEQRLARHRNELKGSLQEGEFNSGGLKGTEEPFKFQLEITVLDSDKGMYFDFLDYPGGWLDSRPEGREKDWEDCKIWIKESTVLLVPVDASVLMEAAAKIHRRARRSILNISQVEDVAREWAKQRNARINEPALLLICPLKCESYFADNGGHRGAASKLLNEVGEVYRDVLEVVRSEGAHIKIIYAPVDTIGCVDIIDSNWKEDKNAPGGFEFSSDYRVRQPYSQCVKGADDVLVSLCKNLWEAEKRFEAEEAERLVSNSNLLEEYAKRNEGFLKEIFFFFTRERAKRKKNADVMKDMASDAADRVRTLDALIGNLAEKEFSSRVHELTVGV